MMKREADHLSHTRCLWLHDDDDHHHECVMTIGRNKENLKRLIRNNEEEIAYNEEWKLPQSYLINKS